MGNNWMFQQDNDPKRKLWNFSCGDAQKSWIGRLIVQILTQSKIYGQF